MALIQLGNFFKVISSKVIRRADLDTMQSEINEIIRDLEKIFPPSCFDIMGLVRNRFHLEASILEGFVALESVNLCSRYLHAGVKTKFSRYQLENEQGTETEGDNLSPMFPKFGHPIGREKKSKGNNFHMEIQLCVDIHRYVLFNTGDEKMETFIMEHKTVIDNHIRSNAWIRSQNHSQEFGNWFEEKVKFVEVPEHLRQLDKGPNIAAKRYTKYFINGYRFHTMKRDSQEEENCPNIEDIGPSNGIHDVDVDLRWSREDVPGDVIDMPTHDQHSKYMEEDMDTSEKDEDFDDVDWDWMFVLLRLRQYLVVMKQRESSRIRNKETRANVPARTLTSLANQKKFLLARRRKDLLIEKRQRLTDVIEEQDVLESHNPEVGVRIQADSTNNIVQPVEEQLQLNSTALEGYLYLGIIVDSSTKKRQRGQTKMLYVHGRHDHKLIVLNKVGQPVGPSNDVVIELSNFLGTLARNATLCPLDIENWKLFDTKQDLWDYTKKMSKANSENRKKLKNPHTVGKKSFALVRNDLAEMENIEMQQNEDGNETIDAFASVMGSEHPRRLRLYGRGVTKTTLKGKVGNFEASSNATNDLVKKMEDRMLRIEEKIEEQKEQFDQQKTTMRQEIVEDVITKLQRSGLPIDVNVLATLLDVSSTRETNIRPIHRSSTSSNNQGEQNEQSGDESSEDVT
ncbi:hypothetical protein KY289_035783 [Solanum tuberosum]|nr:hypothetical protein KY289_035783 [Solanum tuberosum]